ncbi:MAG: VOC family protein [Gemmatimonadaceae bacterium]|nr:VOC family protein [Gemmatimonadaceae bacterium]
MSADTPAGIVCYPCLTYADPDAAMAFLSEAFGFESHAVYRNEAGQVQHAEIVRDGVMLMIGPPNEAAGWDAAARMPQRHASLYLYLPGDVDALCARAWEAGAVITRPPCDTPHGSREFSVRDPEGQEWHFGNYHPLAVRGATAQSSEPASAT